MAGPRRMDDAQADGLKQVRSKKYTTNRTIAGALVLVDGDTDVQAINGGGSNRDVTLPAVTDQNEGRQFEIWNIGATNTLVVKNPAASTLFTVGVGHLCIARQIKGVWYAAGTVTNT